MQKRQSLEFLQIQHGALLNVGLDIGAMQSKYFIKQPWIFLFAIILILYVQFGILRYVFDVFQIRIDHATSALSTFNQTALLMVKISVLTIKSKGLLKLIWDINLLAKSANQNENKIWISENRRSVLVSKIYVTACCAATFCAGIIPIIIMSIQYFQGTEIELKLPFDGRFPFEKFGLPIYLLNYFLSLKYVNTLLNLTSCIDPLFGWFVYAISGHFRILRFKVATAANRIVDDDNHKELLHEVAIIVQYHIRILSFIDGLNEVFGLIFFAEVTFSCLQMCFLIYSLNNASDMKNMPLNALVFAAISIQMIIYCFGAEKVKDENEMLCEDIYMKIPWEKLTPTERKMLQLPLQHSQKDTPLFGLFFELDRKLLIFIFRTAFSFNTFLARMKN